MSITLSIHEAQIIAVASQGFGTNNLYLEDIFKHVKLIQFDPLKIIRESHELICLARGLPFTEAHSLLKPECAFPVFTFPGHAMAILPLSLWPWFSFMRKRIRSSGWRGPDVNVDALRAVRALLNEKKQISVRDFPKGTGKGWDRSSAWRLAAEWLLWTGEAVSTSRNDNRRVYSLAQNVVSDTLLKNEPSDESCYEYLIQETLNALGVATIDDITDYFRLPRNVVKQTLKRLDLQTARVEGWEMPVWISQHAEKLTQLKLDNLSILSPFDSLIWYRPRLKRLFGKEYKLESYKPIHMRSFGPYFMPILYKTNIVGRIAPQRHKGKITITAYELDPNMDKNIIKNIGEVLQTWASFPLL